MFRRVTTTLRNSLLLLAVCTAVLWVRSYWRADGVYAGTSHRLAYLYSGAGGIQVTLGTYQRPRVGPIKFWYHSESSPEAPNDDDSYFITDVFWHHAFGFGVRRSGPPAMGIRPPFYDISKTDVYAPTWFVILLLVVPSVPSMIRRIRRRLWIAAGACARCGYDLRATPDRCPECGMLAKGAA